MGRRAAVITEAEVKRAIRAARKTGMAEVEVKISDKASVVFRLASSTPGPTPLEPAEEIVL